MTAGIGVASRFHRVLDKWLGQYPAAARPHIDGVIAQINADGTARVRKPGHQYASAYNYALPVPDPTRPWKVGDPVQLDESNSRRPRISTIPLPAVVADPRFATPPVTRYPVGQYGADPTGVTDSYTAIMNAAASLSVTGGTIHLDPGTYKLGQPLVLDNHISLEGEGIDTVLTPGWAMTSGQYLLSNGVGAGAPYYRDFQLGGNNAGNGLKVTADSARILNVDANVWLGYGMDVTSVGAYLQNVHASVCGTAGLRLTTSTGARVIGGDFGTSSLVLHGTTYAEIIGLGSVLGLTLEASSQNNHVVECLMQGNVTVDNSSANTLLGCILQGNLTEQNGATNNRYYDSPVTGTVTLLGGSRRRGASGSASDPALSIDVPSGFTPDLINAKSGTFRVDGTGAVVAAGDITPGSGHYLRGGGIKPIASSQTRVLSSVVMAASTTYGPYSGIVTGVPTGVAALLGAVTPSAGTNLNFYPATGWSVDPPGISNFSVPSTGTYWAMIPLDSSGNFKVRCFTGATISVDVWAYLT